MIEKNEWEQAIVDVIATGVLTEAFLTEFTRKVEQEVAEGRLPPVAVALWDQLVAEARHIGWHCSPDLPGSDLEPFNGG